MKLTIALVGHSQVGKTSILRYLLNQEIQEEYVFFNNIHQQIKTEQIQQYEIQLNESIEISLIDTPGNDIDMLDLISNIKDAHAIFVCFDPTNQESYDNAVVLVQEIKKEIKLQFDLYLILCKADLQERVIADEQIDQLLNQYPNIDYFELSLIEDIGQDKFLEILNQLHNQFLIRQENEYQGNEQSENEQQNNKQLESNMNQSQTSAYRPPTPQSQEVYSMKSSKYMKQKQQQVEEVQMKMFDLVFLNGQLSKLVKLSNYDIPNQQLQDILNKMKLDKSYPVVNLIGAFDNSRGKFYAGVARACLNTDAVIVDNGISSGVEKHTTRRGVPLIGVAPEGCVNYPGLSTGFSRPYEICSGHTHLFLISKEELYQQFGNEGKFKINLCKKLAEGKKNKYGEQFNQQRVVHLLMGDQENYLQELEYAVQMNDPILIIRGSQICEEYFENVGKNKGIYSEPRMGQLIRNGHFFGINSLDPEDIAQYVHLFLTVTPYK